MPIFFFAFAQDESQVCIRGQTSDWPGEFDRSRADEGKSTTMKRSLLQFLVCPDCKSPLALEEGARSGEEIVAGALICSACGARFSIDRGIPRFVRTDSYTRSFSIQWNLHRKTQVDSLAGHGESRQYFQTKTGITESELKGKLVLDVGCGTGRYMEIASAQGAEVIGVDLSFAVDAAYANMGSRSGIHVVQADLFKLPFRQGIFDVIYSIGVLHHTPSTREAFHRLPMLLKKGGLLAIWVYQYGGEYSEYLNRVRVVTTRIPHFMLYPLCWICVPVLHAVAKVPVLRKITERIPTSGMKRGLTWAVLDTFDLWSPRFQWKHSESEVRDWFHEACLEDVSALTFPVSMRGRRPLSEGTASVNKESA